MLFLHIFASKINWVRSFRVRKHVCGLCWGQSHFVEPSVCCLYELVRSNIQQCTGHPPAGSGYVHTECPCERSLSNAWGRGGLEKNADFTENLIFPWGGLPNLTNRVNGDLSFSPLLGSLLESVHTGDQTQKKKNPRVRMDAGALVNCTCLQHC